MLAKSTSNSVYWLKIDDFQHGHSRFAKGRVTNLDPQVPVLDVPLRDVSQEPRPLVGSVRCAAPRQVRGFALSGILDCRVFNTHNGHINDSTNDLAAYSLLALQVLQGVIMCLAIPGKITEIDEVAGLRVGKVQFGGIFRQTHLDFLPDVQLGDYVLVHVGFAISKVDAAEAERTLQLLSELGLEEELGPGEPPE
jgi:hydrogenase expression/formation protein HypC